MATTIGGAQSPKTSSINVPDTTGAGTTETTTPQPAPPDSQGDTRQAEASKQLAKDNKPQMDARAGYIQQQLDKAYKNSMPQAPDPNTYTPKDPDKKSDLPEQKPQDNLGAPMQFAGPYLDKNGVGGTGQKTAAPKTTAVDTKQTSDAAKLPQTFDIANVTPEQIKELRDKKQIQLANTIENAKAAYSDFVKANPGVKVIVTTSEGNGGKPVLVVKGAKADKDAHVHTHYHGDNATVGDPLGSKAGQNARIRDTLLKDPHAVFVLPEAANSSDYGPKPDSPSNDKKYGVSWSNVKNQVKTTNDALDAAGVQRPPKESVVSFHSGGGMALVNLVNNNKDKGSSTLQADRLELYDCVYHFGEKDGKILPAYHFESRLRDWSQTTSGQAVKQVIFYRGSNNVSRAAVMEQSVGTAKFKMIDMAKEPSLPKNPGFNPDPHYRTVGQFMGTRPRP
jgi:hypothetical protein